MLRRRGLWSLLIGPFNPQPSNQRQTSRPGVRLDYVHEVQYVSAISRGTLTFSPVRNELRTWKSDHHS